MESTHAGKKVINVDGTKTSMKPVGIYARASVQGRERWEDLVVDKLYKKV